MKQNIQTQDGARANLPIPTGEYPLLHGSKHTNFNFVANHILSLPEQDASTT